jgi:nucleotide-binding universal stress UspA family protein
MSRTGSVVGWDGSPPADEALEWAAQRENHRGGQLRIVRVLDPDGAGDPGDRVADARAALEHAVATLAAQRPALETAAEIVLGDPVAELSRAAGHDRLLVLGASQIGQVPLPGARRIPVALAARPEGVTAVVPAGRPEARAGVIAVISGRNRSRETVEFAVRAATEQGEPLTVVRLRDPHDVDVDPVPFEIEIQRLRSAAPGLDVRLAPGWVGDRYGLLTRSDEASLLVLEGCRRAAAPPRTSCERWLAGHARAPFVVVAERLPQSSQDAADRKLARSS